MLRGSVILTGILACGLGPPRLLTDAAAGPAVSEPSIERGPARGAAPDISTPARFVTIAIPKADCGCSRSLSVTTAAIRVRTVRLVDSVALLPETREAIADEIIRFSAGRRVDLDGSVQADADTIYVLLRPGGAPAHAGSARKRAGRPDDAPLAWTLFRQHQPPSHIFVWVGAVQRLLDGSSIEGRPFTHWPAELRRALLARALGRVAAHEIGHLTCGPSHAPGGLMKRRFTTDDLLWNTTPLAPNGKHRACGEAAPR